MPASPQRIRKAVFPVAGLGTRFLPATKAVPKEMLPVVDRPVIQHVVDEARSAGIEHFVFVTGRNKSAIEDHFDRQPELEATLSERGKKNELDARYYLVKETEIGIQYAVLRGLTMTAAYMFGDRTFEDAVARENHQKGHAMRLQAQFNY